MKLQEARDITTKIEQGAWVKNLPNLPGVAVKVRGWGNSDHRRIRAKMATETPPEQLSDPVIQDALQARAIVDTILVDWKGFDDCPYSKEKADEIIHDSTLAVIRAAVEYAAGTVALEGKASLEDDVKN